MRNGVCLLVEKTDDFFTELYTAFSSYSRFIKAVAFIVRWKNITSLKASKKQGRQLLLSELKQALIISRIQRERYTKEIRLLKTAQETNLGEINQKHPILLPSKHHVSDLLIREIHEANLHSGIQSTLYAIRQRFWILNGKNQV